MTTYQDVKRAKERAEKADVLIVSKNALLTRMLNAKLHEPRYSPLRECINFVVANEFHLAKQQIADNGHNIMVVVLDDTDENQRADVEILAFLREALKRTIKPKIYFVSDKNLYDCERAITLSPALGAIAGLIDEITVNLIQPGRVFEVGDLTMRAVEGFIRKHPLRNLSA